MVNTNSSGNESVFEVVWPTGREVREEVAFSGRVPDLNGKTIAEVQDLAGGGWFPVLREELKRRYPDIKIIQAENFGWTHGPDERQVVADLPTKLKEFGVDAVISGVGL